jgi:hypothetical protein
MGHDGDHPKALMLIQAKIISYIISPNSFVERLAEYTLTIEIHVPFNFF